MEDSPCRHHHRPHHHNCSFAQHLHRHLKLTETEEAGQEEIWSKLWKKEEVELKEALLARGLGLSLVVPFALGFSGDAVGNRKMAEEVGLDLNLFSGSHRALQLKLATDASSSPPGFRVQNASLCGDLSPERNSGNFRVETRRFLKGIDVNRMPEATDGDDFEEEEAVARASSPASTVSSLSLSGTKRGGDNDLLLEEDRSSPRGGAGGGNGASDEEDTSRKKLRLTKDQSAVLEESFKEHPTLNPKQKLALAKQLNLRPRQVEVWFQNRRARTKLKQTEVDCEFLKRCCENLTEENRRLQRELQELRALKLSPQFYMPVQATTLTMCPSCEKLAAMSATNNHCRIPPSAVSPIPIRGFDMPARS